MNSEQIEKFKQEIECIIKEKNYISLRYVLFDETNRTPFAVHIFYKDNLFMLMGLMKVMFIDLISQSQKG